MPRRFGQRPRKEYIATSEWTIVTSDPLWTPRPDSDEIRRVRDAIEEMKAHPRKDPIGVKYAAVLEMRFWGRYTLQQIAKEMGWKDRRWTSTYLRRAQKRLKRMLDDPQ